MFYSTKSLPKRLMSIAILLFILNVISNIGNLNNYNYIKCMESEGVSVSEQDKIMVYDFLSELPPIIIQSFSLNENCIIFFDSPDNPDFASKGTDVGYYNYSENEKGHIGIILKDKNYANAMILYHEFGHYLDVQSGFPSLKGAFINECIYASKPNNDWYFGDINPNIHTIGDASIEYFADEFAFIQLNKTFRVTDGYINENAEKYINRSIFRLKMKYYIIPNYL